MFDFIMHTSMPLWVVVSALFPVYLTGMVIKAIIHARRKREFSRVTIRRIPRQPWMDTQDWVPTP